LFIVATGVAISELRYPGKLATLASRRRVPCCWLPGGNGMRGFLLSGADLIQEACSRVSRNLTAAEWQRDVGARARRSTCPGLPACGRCTIIDVRRELLQPATTGMCHATIHGVANHASARFWYRVSKTDWGSMHAHLAPIHRPHDRYAGSP